MRRAVLSGRSGGSIGYTLRAAGGELRLYLAVGMVLGAGLYFLAFSALLRPLWDFWIDVAASFLHLCALPLQLGKFFCKKSPGAEKTLSFLV